MRVIKISTIDETVKAIFDKQKTAYTLGMCGFFLFSDQPKREQKQVKSVLLTEARIHY